MGKALKWVAGILGVFLLLSIGAGLFVYMSFFKAGPLATLVIDQGTVQYNSGGEWNNAKSGMALKQDYSVKTMADSMAKIIFSDSVMRMDSNTEVKLDTLTRDKVSITQAIGNTWSRLLKISGISDYEVNTPEVIASVRGTGFAVLYDGKKTEVKVAEGNVSVDSYQLENGMKKKIASMIVEEKKEASVDKGTLSKIDKKDLVEDAWMAKNLGLDEQHKKEVKERIMKKYGFIINTVKSKYGLSDEQLSGLFDDWYSGKISVRKSIASGELPEDVAKVIPEEFKRS